MHSNKAVFNLLLLIELVIFERAMIMIEAFEENVIGNIDEVII